MKIHGDNPPSRSTDVLPQKNYRHYRDLLRQDFRCRCGYCAKYEDVSNKGFEIDHFVPVSVDDTRKCDYNNLVYSCYMCNRKKSNTWPTCDKKLPHDDRIGLIDPTSPEYDENLERNFDGSIVGKTPLGTYICEEVFCFHKRPMKEVYELIQLRDKLNSLDSEIQNLPDPDSNSTKYIDYYKTSRKLNEILKFIYPSDE